MKASELRIGNYVSIKNMIVDLPTTIERGAEIDAANGFNPIPLTEEWLMKAGFRKVDYEFNVYELNGVEICFGWGYDENENHFHYAIDFDRGNGYSCLHNAIEYVHQLQNIYFALTGEELTFNI